MDYLVPSLQEISDICEQIVALGKKMICDKCHELKHSGMCEAK